MSVIDQTNVDFNVRINGNNVAMYSHEGKTFVEGRVDTEYALHIKNRNSFRVKVVLTVDQINVINGKPSSGESSEAGYILDAGESQTILGYRLDDDSVAKFKFTKKEASYAQSEHEMKGTTGVLGCRVFSEEVPMIRARTMDIHHHHWSYPTYWWSTTCPSYTVATPSWTTVPDSCEITCSNNVSFTSNVDYGTVGLAMGTASNASNCGTLGGSLHGSTTSLNNAVAMSNTSSMATQDHFALGSTFGQKAESKVTSTSFAVGRLLGDVVIYYDTRAGLINLGVDVTKKPKVVFPEAFSGHYAKPPRGWVG